MTASSYPDVVNVLTDHTDVGSVGQPGTCVYDPDQQSYTLSGAGANIWGAQDEFFFTWQRMKGNFIVTARATFSGAGGHPHRKLGWMARASLDAGSAHASAAVHGDGLVSLQYRPLAGGETEEVKTTLDGADVIQLERKGNTYILSAAQFGDPFTTVQVGNLDLGDEVYLGLFVCSHTGDVLETATFQNVRVVKPVEPGFNREADPFGSRLEILDVETGLRKVVYSADEVFEAPNWTRDSGALIFNRQGRLYRFDLETRTPALIDTGEAVHNNNDHVLSFDGKMLAISSFTEPEGTSIIYTVPVLGGQPKRVTPTGPSYLHGWSPDGKSLVFAGQRGGKFDIYRVPTEGGPEERLTHALGVNDGPEYTPDGRYIYFNSVRSGNMQIWRMLPDGSQKEPLTADACNNWFAHIAPDGKQFIFVSYLPGEVEPNDHPAAKRVYLRTLPLDGGIPRVVAYLYGGQGTMNVPSWSPDGKKVAFVTNTVPF
jgi:Tol biopolymer transport system component